MKKSTFIFSVCLLTVGAMAQTLRMNYAGRFSQVLKQDKIKHAKFVCELMPDFEHQFKSDSKTYVKLTDLIKLNRGNQCTMVFAQDNLVHAKSDFESFIDYQSIDITIKNNGIKRHATGNSHALSPEQKQLITSADLGTEVLIHIKFKYKDFVSDVDGDKGIKDVEYVLTVIPDQEASMNGGFEKFTDYLSQNLLTSFPGKKNLEKIEQAAVRFSVSKKGEIESPQLIRSSGDAKIDQAIIQVISKMQAWKPAKNAVGLNVPEEFTLLFGNTGC